MRKFLTVLSISAGIVSVISAAILCCIYLGDMAGCVKKVKTRLFGKN